MMNHSEKKGLATGLSMARETVPIIWIPPGLPAVKGKIGERQGLVLIDTAAGIELIDRRICSQAACRQMGRLKGKRLDGEVLDLEIVEIDDLSIGSRSVRPLKACVIDLDRLLPPGIPPVLGAVSASFFSQHPATFDLAGHAVEFESSETMSNRQAGVGIPLTLKHTGNQGIDVFARMVIPKIAQGLFEIDTCSTAVIIHPRLMSSASNRHPETGLNQDGSTDISLKLAFAARPEVLIESRAQIKEILYDGVLGLPFLQQIRFTLDMAAQMIWIIDNQKMDA